jgi:hypothetical protein
VLPVHVLGQLRLNVTIIGAMAGELCESVRTESNEIFFVLCRVKIVDVWHVQSQVDGLLSD